MAETLRGIAVRWAIGGISFTGITLTSDASKFQSLEFNRSSDKAEIKDGNGEVAGLVFYNAKKSINVTVIPGATSVANAQGNVDAWLPAPGTVLTAADTEGASIDASSATTYNVLSCKLRLSVDGPAMVDLELERYDANDVTTTIS